MTPQERVRQAGREVPEALVGHPWWTRLEQAASALPIRCHSIFLECHLSEASGRTDLIARFLKEDRDVALREGWRAEGQLAGSLFARWATPSDPLHAMSFIDVEWDVGDTGAVSFICPTLEPILWASPHALEQARREDAAQQRPRRARLLAAHVLRVLYGEAVTQPLLERLGSAFDALPAYGALHYVNFLPARDRASPKALRIIVSLPRRALRGYLSDLGFPGDLDLALARVNRHRPHGPWADIDLDLREDGPGPRLGIYNEFSPTRPTDRVLAQMLERLAEDGRVSPERLAGLAAWTSRPQPALIFKRVASSHTDIALKAYLEVR